MIQVYEGNGELPPDLIVIRCRYAQRTGPWKYIPKGEVRYQVTCVDAGYAVTYQESVKKLIGKRCVIQFQDTGEIPRHVIQHHSEKQTHRVGKTIIGIVYRTKISSNILYIAFRDIEA